MGTVIWILIVLAMVGWAVERFAKAGQSISGSLKGETRSKCAYCGKGLKSNPAPGKFGYAEFCSKCGRQQPWAETANP